MKDQKDKQCRFFTDTFSLLTFIKGANISGGHCIFDLYYLYFYVLLLVFSVICMHQSESNAISILCMYVRYAELTIKQTLTLTFDLSWLYSYYIGILHYAF